MSLQRVREFHRRLLAFGPRASGSVTERRVAEFLLGELRERGFAAQIESFPEASHNATDALLILAESGESCPVLPLQFSAAGSVEGPLVYLGATDKPLKTTGELSGKIGLCFPAGGLESRLQRCLEWERAGLRALIAISPGMDIFSTKILRFPELSIPAVTVTWRTGNRLAQLEGQQAALQVNWNSEPRAESQNVVVEKPGTGPYWLTVSAHYDTAAYAPGAMDNGGGTALLMEVISRLKERSFPATIRFVFTGSEENGGHDTCGAGSRAFYAQRLDQLETCIAHLETDDLGNALGIPECFYRGNRRFLDTAISPTVAAHYEVTEKAAFSCDSGIAAQHGIPFVFLSDAISLPRPWYHTPEDTLECMDFAKLAAHLPHIEGMIERLANAAPFQPWVRHNGVTVRPARLSDCPAIGAITTAAFGPVCMAQARETFFGSELGGKTWSHYKSRDVIRQIRSCLPQAVVAEVEGQVVGYATEVYNPEQGCAEIGNNAVHPDFQGRGIGSMLQREVDRRMRENGFQRFAVCTLEHDVPARRLYEKLGYTKIGATVHYLRQDATPS